MGRMEKLCGEMVGILGWLIWLHAGLYVLYDMILLMKQSKALRMVYWVV